MYETNKYIFNSNVILKELTYPMLHFKEWFSGIKHRTTPLIEIDLPIHVKVIKRKCSKIFVYIHGLTYVVTTLDFFLFWSYTLHI